MSANALEMSTMKTPSVVTTDLIVVSVIFPLLSLSSIVFRYKARKRARLSFLADDWWIVVAWVSTLGISINAWIFSSIAGIDYYKINPIIGISKSLQCLQVSGLIFQVSVSVVKISILLFYKRIFSTKKFRLAAWIGIAVVSAWGIAFFLTALLMGDPISIYRAGTGRYRFNTVALGLAQVGSSIALDFIVLTFPLPIISTLHLPVRKKIAIALIFWLGAFCCIAAIVRLVLLHASLSVAQGNSAIVGSQAKQFVFMILEPHCSIIAACLPCCGPLLIGGRAPEFLIRRFYSVFSFGSHGSSKASALVRDKRQTEDSDTKAGTICDDSESQAEITSPSREWFDSHMRGKNIVRQPPNPSDEEVGVIRSHDICITTKIDVSNK